MKGIFVIEVGYWEKLYGAPFQNIMDLFHPAVLLCLMYVLIVTHNSWVFENIWYSEMIHFDTLLCTLWTMPSTLWDRVCHGMAKSVDTE